MKKTIWLFPVTLLMFICPERTVFSQTAKPESSITAVTVFLDRALVTRTISKKLSKGERILIFDNLPEAIDQNSIQANGEGNAVLKDVKFKKEFFQSITDVDKKVLAEKLSALADSIIDATDVIANANKEQKLDESLLEKILAKSSGSAGTDKVVPEPDPDKLIKMVNYYRSRLDFLTKQMRFTERKIRTFNDETNVIQAKMNSLGSNLEKSKNFVEVLIDVKDETDVTVNLSYMVHGPSWYPVYDLRVFTDNKKMNITYQAMIQQNTTEDWSKVKLKLSTARANLSGQQPSLSPWYLSLYDNSMQRDADDMKLKKSEMTQMYNSIAAPTARAAEERKEVLAEKIQMNEATVEQGATSAVFVVPGKSIINSDNQQHKVNIMMTEFDAVFRYSTVPKLLPNVFLKAKVTNTSDFPLLAGNTNVFLNNNFVSTSQLGLVSSGQEFWTFLGVDDGFEVKYKTIKQYQKDEGLINKKNKYIYDYIIEITSNKKTEEEIVIWDQIPMSNSADIKVTLLEPTIDPQKEQVKIDDYSYLEWYYKIKPAEKLKIPFKFTVEGPKNKTITGL
jgi:uncharacterized protein (TIGR02231 family)